MYLSEWQVSTPIIFSHSNEDKPDSNFYYHTMNFKKTILFNKIKYLYKTAYQGHDFIRAKKTKYLVLFSTTLRRTTLRFIQNSNTKGIIW